MTGLEFLLALVIGGGVAAVILFIMALLAP